MAALALLVGAERSDDVLGILARDLGTLCTSGKLAWYPGMPWQPMHIEAFFSPAAASCDWAAVAVKVQRPGPAGG